MTILEINTFLTLVVLSFKLCHSFEGRPINIERKYHSCDELAKEAYFDIDQVIGRTWRIVYTWNAAMEDKCLDLIISNATEKVVKQMYNDMHEYLQSQPLWDAATLFIRIGKAKHEVLLFADQGPAGSFTGVPNIIQDGNVITPTRHAVHLIKFFLKLLHGEKYLLMMDCRVGVTSLLSRERKPKKAEVDRVVKTLRLENGTHACVADYFKRKQ